MIEINKDLLNELLEAAKVNPRLRQNYDLRTSAEDGGQRMINALLPGTEVAVHRHPMSNESVLVLVGKLDEVLYDDNGVEIERIQLDPSVGKFGCVVPAGVWHTVEVHEPTVIYEAKDGRYGEDGSQAFEQYLAQR
jgi:cupin fold WbuC family metalloprotein